MVRNYTAKYTKVEAGYMGQLVEWPEVITEGKTIEECRQMLRDALNEMILAYKQQGKEIPLGGDLLEQVLVAQVGFLRRGEAGELAHGPEPALVHGFVDTAGIGEFAGLAEFTRRRRRRERTPSLSHLTSF